MDEKKKLGEILLEAGVIDKFQLKSALAEQNKWGGRLGNHLVQMGILTEELLVKALSKQLKIPNLDLQQMAITPDVLALVPQELAEKFHLIPVAVKKIANKKTLIVAMSDPTNLDAVDELQFRTGHIIKPAVAGDTAIEMGIRRYYYGEEPAPRDPIPFGDPNAQLATQVPDGDVQVPPEQTYEEPTQAPEASLADLAPDAGAAPEWSAEQPMAEAAPEGEWDPNAQPAEYQDPNAVPAELDPNAAYDPNAEYAAPGDTQPEFDTSAPPPEQPAEYAEQPAEYAEAQPAEYAEAQPGEYAEAQPGEYAEQPAEQPAEYAEPAAEYAEPPAEYAEQPAEYAADPNAEPTQTESAWSEANPPEYAAEEPAAEPTQTEGEWAPEAQAQPEGEPPAYDAAAGYEGAVAEAAPAWAPEGEGEVAAEQPAVTAAWSETQPDFQAPEDVPLVPDVEPSMAELSMESSVPAEPLEPGPAEAAVSAIEAVPSSWSAGEAVHTALGEETGYEPTMPGEPTYADDNAGAFAAVGDVPEAADGGVPAENGFEVAPEGEMLADAPANGAEYEPVAPDPLALIPDTDEGRAVRAICGLLLEKGLLTPDELEARLRIVRGGS